jgi:hypothetical protein
LEVFTQPTPQKDNATDAAAERETVISWSDADQVITIHTSQQRMITRLKKNPGATLIQTDGVNFRFEVPLGTVMPRNAKGAAKTEAPKRKLAGNRCSHEGCNALAKKGTKFCRWHTN